MDSETRRSRLQGCYVDDPDDVPRRRGPLGRSRCDPAACPVPHRRRPDDRERGAPRRGRGRRLLDADASTSASPSRRRSSTRRPAASRSRWAARRRAPASSSGSSRPPSGSAPTTSRSRRPSTSSTPRATSTSTSLAGADAADVGLIIYNTFWTSLGHLERDGRAAGRDPQRRQPQVVDARHRRDGLRADRQPLRRPLRDHRQPDALRDQPHPGRPLDRGPRRQLLAAVGASPCGRCSSAASTPRRSARWSRVAMPFMAPVVRDGGLHRRRRLPRQAVHGAGRAAIPAARGRRPATCDRCSATRRARCSSTAGSPVSSG